MAALLFSEHFLPQVILHAHLGIHALQTAVLVSHSLHLGHHRRIYYPAGDCLQSPRGHTAKLCPPFVKAGIAHPVLRYK